MTATRRLLLAAALAFVTACGQPDDPGMHAGEVETGKLAQGATVCGKGPTVEGIDVSYYQGTIDWARVAASGKKFAIARIGDGFYKDTQFARNWSEIKAKGMIRGSYQFFRPDKDATAQADIVVAAVGMLKAGDLAVTCDVEAPSPGVSKATYTAALHTWANRVKAGTGKEPIIYTGHYYWQDYVGTTDFKDLPLWHAQYTSASCPNIPDAWSRWAMWQYSSTGSVPGISGNVDMDRFNGTLTELQALAGTAPVVVPVNQAPRGFLDSAACEEIAGWAQDQDAPNTAIAVHVYIGGPAGDPNAVGYPITADHRRADLCTAIGSCDHGFSFTPPLSFLDGVARPVYAYGIDSAGGANTLLANSPRTLKCARPAAPFPPGAGMKRHVPSPATMTSWKFDWHDIATFTDAELAAYADGPDVTAAPVLKQKKGDAAVYLVENDTLRHVTSPASMDAWNFDFAAIKEFAVADFDAAIPGAALASRPYLARNSAGAVYLLDAPVPLWAEVVSDDVPATLTPGEARQVTFTLKNLGSLPWKTGEILLATSEPREKESALCDLSWSSCKRAGTVTATTAPGALGTFSLLLKAPAAEGTVKACFALDYRELRYFADKGQGGPGDAALCHTFEVKAAPVVVPEPTVPPATTPVEQVGPAPTTKAPQTASPGAAVASGGCGCNAGSGGSAGLTFLAAFALPLLRRRRAA